MPNFALNDQNQIRTFGIKANGGTCVLVIAGKSYEADGIIRTPPLSEELLPGGKSGTHSITFFIRYADYSPSPSMGDTIIINSVSYGIFRLDIDEAGSAILHLKKY